jgi:hypothetical protein
MELLQKNKIEFGYAKAVRCVALVMATVARKA